MATKFFPLSRSDGSCPFSAVLTQSQTRQRAKGSWILARLYRQTLVCQLCLLLSGPPPATVRIKKNTTWGPDPFTLLPEGLRSPLTRSGFSVAVSLAPMWTRNKEEQPGICLGLGNLSTLSWIWAPGKAALAPNLLGWEVWLAKGCFSFLQKGVTGH